MNSLSLPVVPIAGAPLFPGVALTFSLARPKSVSAAQEAVASPERSLVIFNQLDPAVLEPSLQ